MKALTVFLIAASLISCVAPAGAQSAQDKTSFSEKAAGAAFKALAKGYCMTVDLEKLKKVNIRKIGALDEESFRWEYAELLQVIAQSPALEKKFSISYTMDRREAIRQLKGLTRGRLAGMIDAVPDKVIAYHFSRFMSERMDEARDMDLGGQIHHAWDSVVKKIER